jgi:hypothetical protein
VSLLLHGIATSDDADRLDLASLGDEHRPVLSVSEGPFAAIATETEGEVLPTAAWLRWHARIVEELADRCTVAPVRFGVVVPSADVIRTEILTAREEQLGSILQQLDGRVEFRLRGRYHQQEVVRRVLQTDDRAARLRGRRTLDARMELGERVVKGIERRRDEDVEVVLSSLGPTVVAAERQGVSDPLDAFSLSLLVERGAVAFDAAIDELGASSATLLELELVGPLPPYSFVPADRWD